MTSRLYRFLPVALLLTLTAGFHASEPDREFWTPWAELDWGEIGHYDMQIHVHPGIGDEQYDPHETIDRYLEEGFQILAFTPHDYDVPDEYIDSLYPWTRLADIYETIKDVQNPTEDDRTYAEIANGPYQNRDPVELGMVSVEGSEISGPHHINNLFSSLTTGASTERVTIERIREYGGIGLFNHPGRYIERWGLTAHWYVDIYKRYDSMIGQSIYNRIDSHPGDRAFFDQVVHILGPDRPIWLYGEDDMHHEGTLAWNRNVILLEDFQPGSMHPDIQDGSAPDVKRALIEGEFYLWKPSEQYNRRAFNIVDVQNDRQTIGFVVDHPNRVTEVRWQTHDPATDATVTIHRGFELSMDQVPAGSVFVRAELEGPEGTIYTQPVYIR